MSSAGSPCPKCGGVLEYEIGASHALRCTSCRAIITEDVEPKKADPFAGIFKVLGVLIVLIGIFFGGCAILLSNFPN
jgi:hypothetical protein